MENRYYPRWFELYELLPRSVFSYADMVAKEKHLQRGWEILDNKLLVTIDVIRDIIGLPLICNTWFQDGNREYCGYRERNCLVGATFSQHKEGKAADLICAKMSAEDMRQKIIANQDKLPYPIRMEDGVNWLHVDVKDMDYKGKKIYLFKA
jgi:hypothetical protein